MERKQQIPKCNLDQTIDNVMKACENPLFRRIDNFNAQLCKYAIGYKNDLEEYSSEVPLREVEKSAMRFKHSIIKGVCQPQKKFIKFTAAIESFSDAKCNISRDSCTRYKKVIG